MKRDRIKSFFTLYVKVVEDVVLTLTYRAERSDSEKLQYIIKKLLERVDV